MNAFGPVLKEDEKSDLVTICRGDEKSDLVTKRRGDEKSGDKKSE